MMRPVSKLIRAVWNRLFDWHITVQQLLTAYFETPLCYISSEQLNHLRFEGDTSLIANSTREMNDMVDELNAWSKVMSLKIKALKTKVMQSLNIPNVSLQTDGVKNPELRCPFQLRRAVSSWAAYQSWMEQILQYCQCPLSITQGVPYLLCQYYCVTESDNGCVMWLRTKAKNRELTVAITKERRTSGVFLPDM